MHRLILASRSPRRCELLQRMGFPFETDAPDVDETCCLSARDAVRTLSLRKASACAVTHPGCFILAADTLVSLNGSSLGKPSDDAEAIAMLRMLSGKTHQVYTGVAVITPTGKAYSDVDCTDVSFAHISDDEIVSYVRSGEPLDKAGAYALQGRASIWIEHLDGSDTSVIGLPLYLVRRLLIRAGFQPGQKPDTTL